MSNLSLSYDNPVTAVFLRILAWELFVANETLRVQDVVTEQVQAARHEIGLPLLNKQGGAAHDFIQNLRTPPKPFLSPGGTPPKPIEPAWATDWRLLYLPSHSHVRQLSYKPVWVEPELQSATNHIEYLVTLRNPAIPPLRVFLGKERPANRTFGTRRGLYFLRQNDSLYLGQTNEFDIRISHHYPRRNPIWWVFISIEDHTAAFTQDSLNAAESLLISFWNEVCVISNQTRGGDQKPGFAYLQQAILLVEAASAAMIWLIRDRTNIDIPSWSLPFKKWSGKNWPLCYLSVPDA
jgi:hypothetical protein